MIRLAIVLLITCLGAPLAFAQERWFHMGFTPFNYGVTDETQQETYNRINGNQDIILHHLGMGVPWPEAYAGDPYHPNVDGRINDRISNTQPGTKVFLALTPINGGRDGLADYWGEDPEMPRPAEWADKTFDDPMVIEAFTNWCRDLVARFDADYFAFAVEANELGVNSAAEWPKFMTLARSVYATLSEENPGLMIFATQVLKHPDSEFMTTARPLMQELVEYSDAMAVSAYPYLWLDVEQSGNPANLPPNWLTQAADLSPDKPFLVSETCWLAETLWVPEYFIYVEGNAQWQQDYVWALFEELQELQARLAIWWVPIDYDQAWVVWEQEGMDPAMKVWKDDGVWDGELHERPSLTAWQTWLELSRVPVPPPVPGGGAVAGGTPVQVEKADGEQLTITWDTSSCPAAGYHLVWFDLEHLSGLPVTDEICSVGTGGSWTGSAPTGQVSVIVVADDGGAIEGSHGVTGNGIERESRSSLCSHTVKLTDGACEIP